MKTIGLIGGMSWESSLEYYRLLNQGIKERLGGHHSARLVMYSIDFHELERFQYQGGWKEAARMMAEVARKVEDAGAESLLICANTMHKVAPEVQSEISIPILHIVDAVAVVVMSKGIGKVGLLGTSYTMEDDFYRKRLLEKFGIECVIPDQGDRDIVHSIIYDELTLGVIRKESRDEYRRIISDLKENGAEGVILGCTEIPLLISEKDGDELGIPLFDTTRIHAHAAVEHALSDGIDV